MSKRRRYVRFSLVTLLVFMTGVAVLLNHEVQRAKAIEITVNRIEEWKGNVEFRPRENMPAYLSNIVPRYWAVEIDRIKVALFSKPKREPSVYYWEEAYPIVYITHYTIAESHEFKRLLDIGSLNGLREAVLIGTAIRLEDATRLSKLTNLQKCSISDDLLSDADFEDLRKTFPQCSWNRFQSTRSGKHGTTILKAQRP